jgi:soluble lytic murein transglycosylase-like protein
MKCLRFVALPWATALFSLTIVLHPPLFANSNEPDPVVVVDDLRYPRMDLQSASATQLKQLAQWLAQNPSKNPKQKHRDAWIQGWIAAQNRDYASAESFFDKLPKDHTLASWGQFIMLFALLETQPMNPNDPFWTTLGDQLDQVAYRLPTAYADDYALARYAQSLFESTQASWHDSTWEVEQKLALWDRHPGQLERHKVWVAKTWLDQTKKTLSTVSRQYLQQELAKRLPNQIPAVGSSTQEDSVGTVLTTPVTVKATELFKKAQKYEQKGQTSKMLKTWQSIATDYPFSTAALEIQESMAQWLPKTSSSAFEKKWAHTLTTFPPDWLYEMGRQLWNDDRNQNAQTLLAVFQKRYPYHDKAPNVAYMRARIFEDTQKYAEAIAQYETLGHQYAESDYASRAWVKAGLWSMHSDQFEQAQRFFERDLALALRPLVRAQDHYWLGKALLAQGKKQEAKKQFDTLVALYPLTYYATLTTRTIPIANPAVDQIYAGGELSPAHDQLDLYLGIGFHTWAANWLVAHRLDTPSVLYATMRYLHQRDLMHLHSMNHAYLLINERVGQHGLEQPLLDVFFPYQPYASYIQSADTQNVPKLLITAIAKQESAFNPRAQSPANARGLLQMLPSTGKQMAQTLNMPFQEGLLWDPTFNVPWASQYIQQNLDRFEQHLPLALSAYNAGPTRAKRWKKKLADFPADLWIEMIPIQETRTYIKLILRNLYFYQQMYPDDFKENLDYKGLPTPVELP